MGSGLDRVVYFALTITIGNEAGKERNVDPADRDRNDLGKGAGGGHEHTHATGHRGQDERWLRSIVENSSEIVQVLDRDGILLYTNPAFRQALGYDPEEVIGTNVLGHVHPQDLAHFTEETGKVLADGGVVTDKVEYRFRHKDGSWRQMESLGTYLLDDPPVRGVVVATRDVTDRKKAEERTRFQAGLLDAVGQAVIATDLEGNVLYWNRGAEHLYGWPAEEVMDRHVREFGASGDFSEKVAEIMTEITAGNNWSGEFTVQRKDGVPVPVLATYTPVYDGRDDLIAVIGVSTDLTGRKEAEEALKGSEELFRNTFENAPIGVAIVGPPSPLPAFDRRYLRVNRALCEMLGYTEKELLAKTSSEVTHPEDRARSRIRLERFLREGGSRYTIEKRYIRSDGRVVWAMLNVSLIRDPEGNPTHFVSQFQDVTERKEAEERLREAETRYRVLVENVPPIVYIQEPIMGERAAYEVTYMSPRVEDILGYPARRFMEDAEFWNRLIHPDDLEAVVRADERTDASGETFSEEYRMFHRDGRLVWVRDEAVLVLGTGSTPSYWQGVISDISERKSLEERVEHQALHDSLTDLPNRRLFVERLTHSLERTRRQRARGVSVLFLDLDGFKVVNDSLGHEAGDLLLTVVAQRLGRCLRPEDTLARFGGDEFVVLVEDVEEPADAVRIAERIVGEFGRPFDLEGQEIFATASIGISLGNALQKSPEDLLRDADTAMYQAKKEGSGYRVFDPDMYERVVRRLETENDLRRAVEQEEFVVLYQPIFDFGSQEVWGVEALVRWNHPEKGLLDPSEFVPVAEETGLIVPMGGWVLQEACRRAKEWQQRHPRGAPLGVIVNLSAKQLRHPECVETIRAALTRSGLEARSLSLDVTETAFIDTLEGNALALERIQALGVKISIDDFGMGYSSLSYLKRLPADALKIDKSFVKGFGEDTEDTAIVRMVIDVAHTLGLDVVAEGVETWAQAALLAETGCDMAQGYHFAMPLSYEAASEFLAR